MPTTQNIYARTTVSMTDLRRNPSAILQDAGDDPVAVLNHNKPAAYLLSPGPTKLCWNAWTMRSWSKPSSNAKAAASASR